MFCRDTIHFIPPLPACLLSPCPSDSRFFFWGQIPKVKAVSILSKDQDVKITAEKFCCYKDEPLNLVRSVSSALATV